MEIGNKIFYDFVLITRINEYLGVAYLRYDQSVFSGGTLESSHAGSTYRYYPATIFNSRIDYVRALFSHLEVLGVHFRLGDVVDFYGTESPQSHVEKHFCNYHTFVFKFP